MKILEVKTLAIPEIKVIRFERFADDRGFFAEIYRKSDYDTVKGMEFMKGVVFTQCNEAYSKKGTVRGLHFQWNPYMGKMIRVLWGKLVDVALDIRKNSPTYGKIVGYTLTSSPKDKENEWIWLPPGFAHGAIFPESTHVEYFCTGQWSPGCETSISPKAQDIDWSLCDKTVKKEYLDVVNKSKLMTDKDKNGHTLASWLKDPNSDKFIHGKI